MGGDARMNGKRWVNLSADLQKWIGEIGMKYDVSDSTVIRAALRVAMREIPEDRIRDELMSPGFLKYGRK